jgi:DNA-binding transcriptional ArsR family regulator
MKYNILINQKQCIDQGISLKAGALLDLFSELSSWATPATFDDGIYYFLAYNKILADLPLVFSSKRTVSRFVTELKEKGFVDQRKRGKNLDNYVRLSDEGKHLLRFAKNGEGVQGSPILATTLAKNGEPLKPIQTFAVVKNINQGSPKMATNNNTTIINNKYIDFLAYNFLQKEAKTDIDTWEMQNKKSLSDYTNFLKYFEIKVEEEEIEFTPNKLMGRLKRLKFNWKSEKENTSSDNLPTKKYKRIG